MKILLVPLIFLALAIGVPVGINTAIAQPAAHTTISAGWSHLTPTTHPLQQRIVLKQERLAAGLVDLPSGMTFKGGYQTNATHGECFQAQNLTGWPVQTLKGQIAPGAYRAYCTDGQFLQGP